MLTDGKEVGPAIFLIVNKKNQVVAYTSINVPDAQLIREDEDPELFDKMMREGAACLADCTCNHITAMGLKQDKE